mgnify:CR=1 FL=1
MILGGGRERGKQNIMSRVDDNWLWISLDIKAETISEGVLIDLPVILAEKASNVKAELGFVFFVVISFFSCCASNSS